MKDWMQTLAVSIVSVLVWSCTDATDPAIRLVRLTESVVEVRTESRVPDHDLQIRSWIVLMMTKYGLDDDANFERGILNVSINASRLRFTTCNDLLQSIVFAMDLRLMNQSPSQAVGEVTAKYFPSWYSAQCGNYVSAP